jgi:hypothetical protein
MDRIHSSEQRPFEHVSHAAIAVRSVDPQQRHLGILHRVSGSGDVMLMHLAWHCDLKNIPPKKTYLWIDPAIPTPRLRQVAAMCRKVWRSNGPSVPYAFSPPNDCFDQATGQYLLGPTRFGLTCATFVLAVFHAAGLRLIEYESWPEDRPGDIEWQRKILAALRRTQTATPDHIRSVESEVGGVRYRPEEVAGAATVSPLPAEFTAAVERGQEILVRLEALAKSNQDD